METILPVQIVENLRSKEQRTSLMLESQKIDPSLSFHLALPLSISQTLSERHPNLLFSHLFPGYVYTDSPANVGFPFPIPQLASIFGPYIGSKAGVGGYAEVPFYLTSHPDGNRYLRAGEANLLNDKLKRVDLSPSVDDRLTREKVWEALESWLK